jgi:hypothetical protein
MQPEPGKDEGVENSVITGKNGETGNILQSN